jgi:hypothetical protein
MGVLELDHPPFCSCELRITDGLSDSVWLVLKGPTNDWPLALCDFRTVNIEHDTPTNDIVVGHGDGSIENSLIHFAEGQKWMYRSDMDLEDIILFRQTDSSGKMASKMPWNYFPFRN